jgi:hypothetical protein
MDHETRPRLVDVRGTLSQIPIARSSLYCLFDAGELTRIRVGGRVFVTQQSIDEFLARNTIRAGQPLS